jgi:drug/metabolite transporter (DMT)-like permease
MRKALIAIVLAVSFSGVGNVMLRKGMVELGPMDIHQVETLYSYLVQAVRDPWIAGGIFFNLADFALWLTALSWADVSWAVPVRALEHIIVALLALFFLGENLTWTRWVGIVFIVIGIAYMMRSWSGDPLRQNEGSGAKTDESTAC